VVACLLAAFAAAPATAAEPAVAVYMADEDFPAEAVSVEANTAAAATAVTEVRKDFLWPSIEPRPGEFDWGTTDRAVEGAARAGRGLRIVPTLVGTPVWARAGAADVGDSTYAAPDPQAFARFVAAVAARYGPDGSFMTTERLRSLAIRTWEIWNEPNIPAFWRPSPDPVAYAALLREAARALRDADPGAEIVTGGLPVSSGGMLPADFLRRLYAAGAAPWFDTLAVHPYAPDVAGVLAQVKAVRDAADRAGGALTPIRVTEFGWATGGDPSLFTARERLQAQLVADSMFALRRAGDELRVKGIVYFRWRDPGRSEWARDPWPHHAGLLRSDGSAKPSLAAFASAVERPLPRESRRRAQAPLRVSSSVRSALASRVPRHGLRLRVRCSRACTAGAVAWLQTPGSPAVRRVVARASRRLPGTRARILSVRIGRRNLARAGSAGTRLVLRVGARAGLEGAVAPALKVRVRAGRLRVYRSEAMSVSAASSASAATSTGGSSFASASRPKWTPPS
jgi:hypothetical protein